jgi:hypothetical protein
MESPKKQPDYVNTLGVVVVGLAGALLVYISFVGLQAYYYAQTSVLEAERDAEGKSAELRTLLAEQESELKGYRRLDAAKNTVTLPIDVAMRRVVEVAAEDRRATLVPVVGAHDTPTVQPVVASDPFAGLAAPATPEQDAPAPAGGEDAPAPAADDPEGDGAP